MIPDSTIQACARAAHEVNRAYCIAIGDASQTPWEQAPDWQRTSAVNGVNGVLLRGNNPRTSHEEWMAEKAADGWKYGPVKDPVKKEHPAMLPYDRLPKEQRQKDTLFIHVVREMAQALGTVPAATVQ